MQSAYAPLHYVLLFPKGELGWYKNIPYSTIENFHECLYGGQDPDNNPNDNGQGGGCQTVTQREY